MWPYLSLLHQKLLLPLLTCSLQKVAYTRHIGAAYDGISNQCTALNHTTELRHGSVDRDHACIDFNGTSLNFHLRSGGNCNTLRFHLDRVAVAVLSHDRVISVAEHNRLTTRCFQAQFHRAVCIVHCNADALAR